MGHHGLFQLRLAIRYRDGAAVTIEELDSEIVVESQPVGQFFLESFGDALGHGGINRRSASMLLFRAIRFAGEPLHPKPAAPLRFSSFSGAPGRVHHRKTAQRHLCIYRTPRLRPDTRSPPTRRRSS